MSTTPPDAPGASPPPARRNRVAVAAALAVLLVGVGVGGYIWWAKTRLPAPGSPAYEEYVEAFEVGLAALDVGVGDVAERNLSRAIELIPREPAGWADRGLFYLRSRQFPQAAADLARAEQLAPDNPDIQTFLGLLDEQQGRFPEAAARFRRVAEKNPQDVEALFALARLTDKERNAGSDEEYQRLMEKILAVRPDNRLVLVERLQVAVRRADRTAVDDTLARFRRLGTNWSELTRAQFAEAEKELVGPLGREVGALFGFRNVLMSEPGYARDAAEVNPPDAEAGRPLRTFLRLVPAKSTPAAPDDGLSFTPEAVAGAPPGRWDVAVPVWLTADAAPVVFVANDREVRRTGSGAALPSLPLAPDGLVALDWNNDFRTDLLLAGPRGIRFYQQGPDGSFADVTAATKLPADVLAADVSAVLAADLDLDGDLDVVVARRSGPPVWLRNNLDGTFLARPVFPEAVGVRVFAWADFDDDGVADAAAIDARGRLHVFANERFGQFVPWPAAPPDGRFLALAVADLDADGVLDLAAVRDDGAVVRICGRDRRGRWDVAELARGQIPAGTEPGAVRLLAEDLDNNGAPDLLVSGPAGGAAWLGAGGGAFTPLAAAVPPRVSAAADLAGTGSADLLAIDGEGRPVRFRSAGTKGYHWQTVRFRAQPQGNLEGDNRVNSFGIGGEIEVRTGTHVVKRPIAAPAVRVGLGERTRASVLRVRWPNGVAQVEFSPGIDQTVSPLQRLKGSCPFLFTWNGERFVFVADFMWSTPLGMYINAQDRGGLLQTREWVRVRGDQLVPRDGHYEVRAQANLWETHYFDHLALHVVDHPPGTELYADERFALEPAEPTVVLTAPTRPVAAARDHRGADATAVVRAVDGVYLDRCGRGLYQGVTHDHWVEVELGDDAPRDGPVWLVAHGWIHPTDSSINLALEQGTNPRPRGLVVEVPDGRGGWRVARDRIGFPAGKNKTVLIRLDGLGGPGVCRRFRLRTNMEVFWDALHVAPGRDTAGVRKTELRPAVAELRYRGILKMSQANPSSPELPDYDTVVSQRQVWRDLIGFHTRFGDVTELLAAADDRYAILNAGDEIALRFLVPPAPPPGWGRTFVWVSDGWVKDGDLNTRFGGTVLPLPYHGMPGYDVPPGRLADDPVYRRFPADWAVYHTRHVTPSGFERGLRPWRGPAPQPGRLP